MFVHMHTYVCKYIQIVHMYIHTYVRMHALVCIVALYGYKQNIHCLNVRTAAGVRVDQS